MRFSLSCSLAGAGPKETHLGHTVNVSPGGLYFKTSECSYEPGSTLEITLTMDSDAHAVLSGVRMSAVGRVLRTDRLGGGSGEGPYDMVCYGMALEFSRSPRFLL